MGLAMDDRNKTSTGPRTYPTISHEDLLLKVKDGGGSLFDVELGMIRQGIVPLKYARTVNAIGLDNLLKLRLAKIAVLGCGGVGDYACEALVRMGVGSLIVVDGDVFEETNLNRQLYSYEDMLGKSKAIETGKILRRINSADSIVVINAFLSPENFEQSIADARIVIDALDRLSDRLCFSAICSKLSVPYFFGNIGSQNFRIGVQDREDNLLERIYSLANETDPAEGSPVISAGLCGISLAAEAVKFVCGIEHVLFDELFQVNWFDHESIKINLLDKGGEVD